MKAKSVVWPQSVKKKLTTYRSERFTTAETYDFIVQLVLSVEDLLLNPIFSESYVEEAGKYKGLSRLVIKKFKIYYEVSKQEIIILAIKFPGERT